jgi:hypothetical protein
MLIEEAWFDFQESQEAKQQDKESTMHSRKRVYLHFHLSKSEDGKR